MIITLICKLLQSRAIRYALPPHNNCMPLLTIAGARCVVFLAASEKCCLVPIAEEKKVGGLESLGRIDSASRERWEEPHCAINGPSCGSRGALGAEAVYDSVSSASSDILEVNSQLIGVVLMPAIKISEENSRTNWRS